MSTLKATVSKKNGSVVVRITGSIKESFDLGDTDASVTDIRNSLNEVSKELLESLLGEYEDMLAEMAGDDEPEPHGGQVAFENEEYGEDEDGEDEDVDEDEGEFEDGQEDEPDDDADSFMDTEDF